MLQATLDALPSHIAVLDEHGVIVLTNESWDRFAASSRRHGAVGSSYLAMCDAAALDEPTAAAAAVALRQVLAGDRERFETEYPCPSPDGERWFVMRIVRQDVPGPVRVVVEHDDVTDRLRAEREAAGTQQAAARLAAIVASSQDAILSKDLDGTITSWNSAAEELYGYSAEEAIGRSIDLILIDRGERDMIFSRIAAGERIAPYETRRRRRDGTEIDIAVTISPVLNEAGAVTGAAAIARDITDRKAADHALRLSEQRHRAIVSQLPDAAMFQYDRDMRIVMTDGALIDQLGYRDSAIVGKHISAILPPERAEAFAEHLAAALKGESHSFDWEATNGDILSLDIVPLRDADDDDEVTGAVVLARDVSERRRTEHQLRIQAQMLDRLDAAVIATDLEGRVTHWNRQAEETYERPAGKVLGRPVAELNAELGLVHPDDLLERLVAGETFRSDFVRERADGTLMPLLITSSAMHDAEGRVTGFAGIGLDMTRRHRAAQELRSARELFESSFESAPMGMALIDAGGAQPGAVLRVNRAMCDMLGHTSQGLVGRRFSEVLHAEDEARMAFPVDALLGDADTGFAGELRFRHATGVTVWADVSMSLIRDADGAPMHAVALVHDVTQARRDREERTALEARLDQAQKLDSIGRLAGGIAHDFNNLLAVILTYAELVSIQLPDDGLRQEVEQITKAGERAAALTRQLLVFGRQEVVQPRALDLNAVVEDTHQMLHRTLGEHVELRMELGAELRTVRADRSQLEQVLVNLAVNGRDAMADGGVLTIRTCNVEDLSQQPGVTAGPCVRIEVTDTGCGMEPDVARRVFEPFFTTKPRGAGTGLGLATVYGVVTKAGGRVDLSSEPGRGTTFRVTLPAEDSPADEDAAVATIPEHGAGETVLLVEDEQAVRSVAALLLRDGGYDVLEAGDADEALALAEHRAIDLLLTDVVMPGRSGSDLASVLRDERPWLPVLYMSGYTDDVTMRHGVQERKVAFVEKPFTRTTLLGSVRAVLEHAKRQTDADADARAG